MDACYYPKRILIKGQLTESPAIPREPFLMKIRAVDGISPFALLFTMASQLSMDPQFLRKNYLRNRQDPTARHALHNAYFMGQEVHCKTRQRWWDRNVPRGRGGASVRDNNFDFLQTGNPISAEALAP